MNPANCLHETQGTPEPAHYPGRFIPPVRDLRLAINYHSGCLPPAHIDARPGSPSAELGARDPAICSAAGRAMAEGLRD